MKATNKGLIQYFGLFIATLVLAMFLGTQASEAANMEKVVICHYDADTDLFTKLSVSENAVAKHFENHDDVYPPGGYDGDCNVLPSTSFALAYINVDQVPGYDPSTDVSIAELRDMNNSGVVDPGDVILTDHYPLGFDNECVPGDSLCVAPFIVVSHTVINVIATGSGFVSVETDAGGHIWRVGTGFQNYQEFDLFTTELLFALWDRWNGGNDEIRAFAAAPSKPSLPTLKFVSSSMLDDNFLDVEIELLAP